MSSDNTTPPSPAALRLHWDVFLSFRSEDAPVSLTESLFRSLAEHGTRVFKDDVGMTQGDEIAPTLLEAIEDSAASIIILSRRYADSYLCLEGLARICELRRLILPVFYQVDPSHVRKQSGHFEQDFKDHVNRFGEEKVAKWRKAMEYVGGLSGFVYNGSDSEERKLSNLSRQLVNRVLKELKRIPMGIATYTVGLESQVEKLMSLLDIKSSGIKVLGLHGMGGIGKTTLAKALFNKLVIHFECRCFIESIREISSEDGLVSLQKKLLHALSSNTVPPVNEVDDGVIQIKHAVHDKKVLIVLDDVGDVSQLNALTGSRDWFSQGSRVIITTRNQDALVEALVNETYEVRELYDTEALQLFSYHALRREKPTKDYLNLSKKIVSLTGRLPLALEVFGSFLLDKRRIEEWEDALKKLQEIRPCNLQDVLKISFEALEKDEKSAFLDIACLFIKVEMNREEAIDIMKGCGLSAESAINALVAKSLIKIREDCSLWMHDQIRDMGRQIVRCEDVLYPGRRSRLWDRDEIMKILSHNKHLILECFPARDKKSQGSDSIQGFILDFRKKRFVEDPVAISQHNFLTKTKPASIFASPRQGNSQHRVEKEGKVILSTESFESMTNLRLLQINHAKLEGRFESFPAGLKWLCWKECPLTNLPSDYSPWELTVLDLSESGLERVWHSESHKVAENLMVLNLHGCYNLVATPDLSGYKALEKLDLVHCKRLDRIHESVGNVNTLTHLNLAECSNLVELPSDVSGLKLLQNLTLSGCAKLKMLPQNIGVMNSLKELVLNRTAISKLPDSIYCLTKLEKLSLDGCALMKQLPKSIGNLISLKVFSLYQSAVEELPESIGSLSNLEKLDLMWCKSLNSIPESVGNLHSLTELLLNHSAVKELPASIGSLCYLKNLSAGGCFSLTNLPDSIEGLASLHELQLDGTSLKDLPDQIGGLKMIDKLEMRKCTSLISLPEAIGSMLTLTSLNLFGANITLLPESIGMLENLVMLNLSACETLEKLPDSIGNLKSLHHLLMERTAVTELPETFGLLSSLMILKMRKKPLKSNNLQDKLVVLPASFSKLSLLEDLDARAWRISGKIPDDFEKLSALEILDISYNNFCCLPSSLRGLSLLRKLFLSHCNELKSIPSLPSSLEVLDAANCIAVESIADLSDLESLELLNLTNCEKLVDIPGLSRLKSLTRLYLSGCSACSLQVRRRLSKVCLRNIRALSLVGSKIPDWFLPNVVTFSEHRNHEIRSVIIAAIVSFNHQIPDDLRDELPVVPAIQASILNPNQSIFGTVLDIQGVPKTNEDQLHLCRFASCHPLVSKLKEGYKIEVSKPNLPFNIEGVEVKKCGIHLVYENDDDYEGNEESLDESQQSVSEKLATFFNSEEKDGCSLMQDVERRSLKKFIKQYKLLFFVYIIIPVILLLLVYLFF